MAADVNVGVNSVQISGKCSGLIGENGRIRSNLFIDSGDGIRLQLPAALFPFLTPGEPCFVAISVLQVNPLQPVIEEVKSSLILPPGR